MPFGHTTGEQRGGRSRQAGRRLPAALAGAIPRREGTQPAQSHVGHSELHGPARVPHGQAGGAHARTDARLFRGQAPAIPQRHALQLHELGYVSARPHRRGEQRAIVRSIRDGSRAETVRYEPDRVRRTRRRVRRSRARLPADRGRIRARAVVRLRSALLGGFGGIDHRRSTQVPRRRVRCKVRRRSSKACVVARPARRRANQSVRARLSDRDGTRRAPQDHSRRRHFGLPPTTRTTPTTTSRLRYSRTATPQASRRSRSNIGLRACFSTLRRRRWWT